jgi:hypothetical protein
VAVGVGSALLVSACGGGPSASAGQMRAAAASGDFCQLARAIARSPLDGSDTGSVVATYRAFDRAVRDATNFVPAELARQWAVIAAGAHTAATLVAHNGGDLHDPKLWDLLAGPDFRTAYDAVDNWVLRHCTDPGNAVSR